MHRALLSGVDDASYKNENFKDAKSFNSDCIAFSDNPILNILLSRYVFCDRLIQMCMD